MNNRHKYSSGQRINNIVLIEPVPSIGWKAKCDCGVSFITRANHLYRRKSCGCLGSANQFRTKSNPLDVLVKLKYTRYQYKAKKRSIIWDLSLNCFKELLYKNCFYCNAIPSMEATYRGLTHKFNGIDRIKSNEGYTTSNSVSCCWLCNRAKGNLSLDQFLNWVENLTKGIKNNFL